MTLSRDTNNDVIQCALYACALRNRKRAASLEKQKRICRAAAEKNGWAIVEGCVFGDSARSVTAMPIRNGLTPLIAVSKMPNCRFDWVVIDDTSRLARNLGMLKGTDLLPLRDGLASLIAAAMKRNCPFNRVVIDDPSRLGRDVGTVLKVTEILAHYGICVYFVNQNLHSQDGDFRLRLAMYGLIHEQYTTNRTIKKRSRL